MDTLFQATLTMCFCGIECVNGETIIVVILFEFCAFVFTGSLQQKCYLSALVFYFLGYFPTAKRGISAQIPKPRTMDYGHCIRVQPVHIHVHCVVSIGRIRQSCRK